MSYGNIFTDTPDITPVPESSTSTPLPSEEDSPEPLNPLPSEDSETLPDKPDDQLPKVAIIIDDLGNSATINKSINEISVPLTLAILPFRLHTGDAVNYFSGTNRFELILHMPMEPLSEEEKEENMLMENMSEAQIEAMLDEAFSQMGNSILGMNNHKGSFFTSDREKMSIILNVLKKRNLYFLDSYTSSESVGYSLAMEIGVKTTRRHVFLDGQNNEEYIREKLYETVRQAEEDGYAVAIGHAKENTIKVLREEEPYLLSRVNFVKTSQVVR
ncbi:MAG: divergent polysaccharide deacetylase family protein [Patescibacteria group bacterium]